jgi:hypothetical protein
MNAVMRRKRQRENSRAEAADFNEQYMECLLMTLRPARLRSLISAGSACAFQSISQWVQAVMPSQFPGFALEEPDLYDARRG